MIKYFNHGHNSEARNRGRYAAAVFSGSYDTFKIHVESLKHYEPDGTTLDIKKTNRERRRFAREHGFVYITKNGKTCLRKMCK